ncbi:hypothetical protein SAMN04487996_107123 [Dyadobacter soli]|uniref:Uncharacterized protein n=1 Tax=Dyadobacter soli TaxID=659014 RepID=A0A1G7G4N1_9BACT|nr:hypothetical protein [Dyadobacter soli]SDE83126.1 hypothetical protein SAMN04487996_107123 [Dyadobacter soli]
MNLDEIQSLLKEAITNPLKFNNEDNPSEVTGLYRYRIILEELRRLGIESKTIGDFSLFLHSYPNSDLSGVDSETMKYILTRSIELRESLVAVSNFISRTFPPLDEDSLRIRLPDGNGFQDLEKYTGAFKIAFTVPLRHPQIDGTIQILRGEPGSVWLVVKVLGIGKMAYKLINDICWSGAVIWRKVLDNKMVAQEVRSYELQNDYQEMLLNAQKKLIDKLVNTEASGIITRNRIKADPEYRSQLAKSIMAMHELFIKGAEVQPSLKEADKAPEKFPDLKHLQSVESRIKAIPEQAEGAEKPRLTKVKSTVAPKIKKSPKQ